MLRYGLKSCHSNNILPDKHEVLVSYALLMAKKSLFASNEAPINLCYSLCINGRNENNVHTNSLFLCFMYRCITDFYYAMATVCS